MSAMKRLSAEYRRSGWNLEGLPVAERLHWRRLLPEDKARPKLRAAAEDEPLERLDRNAKAEKLTLAAGLRQIKPPWEGPDTFAPATGRAAARPPDRPVKPRKVRKAAGHVATVGTYQPDESIPEDLRRATPPWLGAGDPLPEPPAPPKFYEPTVVAARPPATCQGEMFA